VSLSEKTALVIGAGGLGGPALLTLAAARVGRLLVLDPGAVTSRDLSHQALFREADLGAGRAAAAADRLRALFPDAAVEGRAITLEPGNAVDLLREADVALEGQGDFAVQFLASDAAMRVRRPLVHGAVLRTTAQVLTIAPAGLGGCLRCLFEGPPPAGQVAVAAAAGVLGPLATTVGGLMAAEVLRLLAGQRGAYEGRLFTYEARSARSRLVLVRKRAGCPGCAGTQPLEGGAAGEPGAAETTTSRREGTA
jgi:molybdopterin/thiamine biosynthesis adenylyltransferase